PKYWVMYDATEEKVLISDEVKEDYRKYMVFHELYEFEHNPDGAVRCLDALKEELDKLLMIPGDELVAGAGGIAEGIPAKMAGQDWPKFRPGGLNIVRAGGGAGMFSAVIGGWAASGEIGSIPVTKEITE
ncbi:MAG: hypothetical protein HN478_17400, partial [Rhodospirillaceae bacterium]|nr:hypothetical protein [Rhodospirillaceae bacterium]